MEATFDVYGKLDGPPVSAVLGGVETIGQAIDGPASCHSLRGMIELNSIALLSNYENSSLDTPLPAMARALQPRAQGGVNQSFGTCGT